MVDEDAPSPAPEFPEGLEWINVEQALTLEDLAGKLVLLEFWTSC